MILVKRMYGPPGRQEGARFLVERLWPRGMKAVTLLYSARDTEHNNAVALKAYLENHLKG